MMRKDKLASALIFISLSCVCVSQYSLSNGLYVTMIFFGVVAIATLILAIQVLTGDTNI